MAVGILFKPNEKNIKCVCAFISQCPKRASAEREARGGGASGPGNADQSTATPRTDVERQRHTTAHTQVCARTHTHTYTNLLIALHCLNLLCGYVCV